MLLLIAVLGLAVFVLCVYIIVLRSDRNLLRGDLQESTRRADFWKSESERMENLANRRKAEGYSRRVNLAARMSAISEIQKNLEVLREDQVIGDGE